MSLELQTQLEKWPSLFDTSDDSNIYKIMQVIIEEFNDLVDVANELLTLRDTSTISGQNLDLWAADFGLIRTDETDSELRAILDAKITNTVDGNDVNNIIRYFEALGYSGIYLTERFISSLGEYLNGLKQLDSSFNLIGKNLRRARSFDVTILDPYISSGDDAVVDFALQNFLKAGGVEATLNLFLQGGYGIGDYDDGAYGEGESGVPL